MINLREVDKKSNEILALFIDEIGFDGEYYVSQKNCPVILDGVYGEGGYIDPGKTTQIETIIQKLGSRASDTLKKHIKEYGVIKISKDYQYVDNNNPDLLISLVHEKIHSHRNLLVFDAYLDGKEAPYISNGESFEQVTNNYDTFNADPSQDILKGSINTSEVILEKYKDKSDEELAELSSEDKKQNTKMTSQGAIDETLVELMAVLSYKLYKNKKDGIDADIWQELDRVAMKYDQNDSIVPASKLILKHHDLDLFRWMIDPLSYQNDDIHYDFFAKYTENDQELVDEICHKFAKERNKGLDSVVATGFDRRR